MMIVLVESTELFVEGSKVAFFLHLLSRSRLALEHGKDNGVEFSTEFVLLEHLFEEGGDEFGFEPEHTTAESTQNEGVMAK